MIDGTAETGAGATTKRLVLAVALLGCLLQNLCAAKTVNIGTGSGEIVYATAQATLNLLPGDTVYIRPGTYASLQLSGITGAAAAPITVKADPGALFTTTINHPNTVRDLAYVVFDGLKYVNYNGPAMRIQGASHDVTFSNGRSTSGGGFIVYDSAKVFNGTKDSAFYNFKWQNWTFFSATINNSDWQPVSNLISLWLDFEISHCTFAHYDASHAPVVPIDANKAFNLQVHDCTFSDVGVAASPVGHGVCIGLQGYAKIYNNRFTRQWADDVREFPLKLNAPGYNGADAVTRFYNNISREKRKYAMFEHNQGIAQSVLDDSKGYLSRTSAEIYFNTLYRSRKVDYTAPLVDIYAPNITIRYNLIVEPECDAAWNPQYDRAPDAPYSSARNYVYAVGTDLGKTPNVVVDHNLVFQTLKASGLNDAESLTPSATSLALTAAHEKVAYISDDYYHQPRYRGTSADAGAVARQGPAPRRAGATAHDAKAAGNEKTPHPAQPAAKQPAAAQVPAQGSWYLSENTTAANWSKTGLFYEKPWYDHVDARDNTTLELYVKALTPHTIEVFNAKKLAIGMLARPDAAHPKPGCDVKLGDYVQLSDQNWTKVSIPLADFKGVNPHDIYFFPGLPIALGTGDYSLGVDEIRFVGGSAPVVWYGDAHPNNPIAIHGPGMKARFMATGGVDLDQTVRKK